MMTMRRTTISLLGFLLLVGLVGCATDGQELTAGEEPADGSGDDGAVPVGELGGGDGPLFASVARGGGFAVFGADFRSVPDAVAYADGTTFSPGVVVMSFPGPAVVPVVRGEVPDDDLRTIAAAAAEAGLLDGTEADFGDPPIADATTTSITVVVDGEAHETSVYAEAEADPTVRGLDEAASEARRRVSGFVDVLTSTVTGTEGERYDPERYRMLPLRADETDAGGTGTDGPEADEREWPLSDVALTERSCTAVTGEQADILEEALDQATEITRWRVASGEVFTLAVRPVLPHEPGCPEGS